MSETPLISVIVPTCNRRDLLPFALTSLAGQTRRDFEVVVVNDGDDEVDDIVASFAASAQGGPEFSLVRHPRSRMGLSAARNSGIAAARGKYLAYLDDDDRLLPNHLELLGAQADEGLPVVYSASCFLHQRLNGGVYETVEQDYFSVGFSHATLAEGNIATSMNVLHHRNCLRLAGRFATYLKSHEDWDLWQRISRFYPFLHLPEVTAEYYLRENSGSMSANRARMRDSWLFVRRQGLLLESLSPAYTLLQNAAAPRVLGRRGAEGGDSVCLIAPVGRAGAFLADAAALAALEKTLASLDGNTGVILAAFGDEAPELYQLLAGKYPQLPLTLLWLRGDCGRLAALNAAAALSKAAWLLFLEPYLEPRSADWLERLKAGAKELGAGLAGPAVTVISADAAEQEILGGSLLEDELVFGFNSRPGRPGNRELEEGAALPSMCLLVRRELFIELDGFDLAYAPSHYGEADLCRRAGRSEARAALVGEAGLIWNRNQARFVQTSAGLVGRRVFWDNWSEAPFALESLVRGADWSARPEGMLSLWPSEGRLPPSFNVPLPLEYQE